MDWMLLLIAFSLLLVGVAELKKATGSVAMSSRLASVITTPRDMWGGYKMPDSSGVILGIAYWPAKLLQATFAVAVAMYRFLLTPFMAVAIVTHFNRISSLAMALMTACAVSVWNMVNYGKLKEACTTTASWRATMNIRGTIYTLGRVRLRQSLSSKWRYNLLHGGVGGAGENHQLATSASY